MYLCQNYIHKLLYNTDVMFHKISATQSRERAKFIRVEKTKIYIFKTYAKLQNRKSKGNSGSDFWAKTNPVRRTHVFPERIEASAQYIKVWRKYCNRLQGLPEENTRYLSGGNRTCLTVRVATIQRIIDSLNNGQSGIGTTLRQLQDRYKRALFK